MNEQDGHRIEAAQQFGFRDVDRAVTSYICTEAQLIAFAKGCERAGLAHAYGLANRDAVYRRILDIDAELKPILAAEEERSMTAAGYVRGTDDPGKRWVKPEIEITIFNAVGEVVSHEVCEAQTATQAQIDDMVAMIGNGTPAHLAATLAMQPSCESDNPEDYPSAFDGKQAAEAADKIFDYADLNLTMFDACCDETPQGARDIYNAAKVLRDLMVKP